MNYAYEIRQQAEAAPRAALPAVTVALWRAFGDGQVSEAEAEALSELIEALTLVPSLPVKVRARVGSRPRTDASMDRRRRWAASGRLPPAIASRFTLAEQAALAVVAAETVKRGDCRLCHEHVAAAAGVSRSTVKAALRQARMLGLLTIEERRLSRYRNDTNIVRIVATEWTAWLRLSRAGGAARGGGVKSATRTNTPVSYSVNSEGWKGRRGYRGVESRGGRQNHTKTKRN